MKRTLPLLLLLACVTATAVDAAYQGFDATATGQAQLNQQGNSLHVSNLGSSGQDGVRIGLGGGHGGAEGQGVSLAPWSTEDFGAQGVRFQAPYDNGRVPISLRCYDNGNSTTVAFEEFPGLASGQYKITVYLDGVEQVCVQGGPPQFDVAAPPTTIDINTVVQAPDASASKSAKIGGPYINWEAELELIQQLLIILNGAPPVNGNSIVVESMLPASPQVFMDDFTITAPTANANASLTLSDAFYKKNYKRLNGIGTDTMLTLLDGADLDCDGAADSNGHVTVLKVSNLGSSGCDGVRTSLDSNEVGAAFQMVDVSSPAGQGQLSHESFFLEDGNNSSLKLDLVETSSGTRASVVGSSLATFKIDIDGNLTPVPGNEIDILSWSWGVRMGSYVDDDGTLWIECDWPAAVDMEDPARGTSLGQGTGLRWRHSSSAVETEIVSMSLMGANAPACGLQIAAIRTYVNTDEDPDEGPARVASFGDSDISHLDPKNPTGRLKVSNLGSSGCDGVSIISDDDDDIEEVHWKLGPMEITDPNSTNAQVELRATGKIIDKASPKIALGTLTMGYDGAAGSYVLTPDYAGTGTQSVRVIALNQGQVVGEVSLPDRSAVATFTNLPSGCGKEPAVGPTGATLCFVMEWELPENVFIQNLPKASVMADELRVIAEQSTGPLVTLSEVSFLVADHEPFVFYDIILRAAQVTSVPELNGPVASKLLPNYPNPFNPQTTLSFELAQSASATLNIYAVDGRRVSTLVQESLTAGRHEVVWNGLNASGQPVASGTYYVQLRAGDQVSSQKITLVK